MQKPSSISQRLAALDGVIPSVVVVLLAVGIIMVFSATMVRSANEYGTPYYYLLRHLASVLLALMVAIGVSLIPFEALPRLSWPLTFLTISLLVIVLVPGVGVTHRGATRWLNVYGFCFQPSELAKFTLPLFLASVILTQNCKRHGTARVFMATLPVVLLIILLIAAEPDYGTAGLLVMICGSIYFVAQTRLKHIVALAALTLPSGLCAYHFSPHFKKRIVDFVGYLIDPANAPWHLRQAWIAMGWGGVFGKGPGGGMQKHLVLAESFNDFAFASLAEEGGFIAAAAVVILFLVLVARGVTSSLTLDVYFARLLAFGLSMSLGIQSFMNICVVLGLMPTKGMSLPFISYGGSGMLANLVTVGLLLSVLRSRVENGGVSSVRRD
ncbi:MAG: FtsW/RodA/SpoVE family cell cycle protein [Candidatus Coatesbacteria bacterium]|nr:FtsW/RodA/SpoVE family cell cycle protein [Candidatus Coatesbacteria bacterium]